MRGKLILLLIWIMLLPFAEAEAYHFTDDNQDEILLSHKPQKTAVLFSSFADMWLLSGGEIDITVGETIERGFVKNSTYLVDQGAGKKIDVEALIMAEPDFIIGSNDIPAHVRAKEQAEKAGIPFALFHVESLDDYIRVFKIMTRINQNEEAFEVYANEVYENAQRVIKEAEKFKETSLQNVLFIRSGSSYSSAKAKTKDMHFAAKMLDDLGAYNIAEDVPVIIDGLSFEEIYLKDPDAIFISLMGNEEATVEFMKTLLNEPRWQALKAVQSGRCYFLSKELFQYKPNAQWAKAYEEMAKMLYPEWTIK
ncbi:MAG: ABC transporter substrate-binding protein [Clostridia bacterium]|nr:ABC transporter substrate-binding protein [Clostridia bacterium]